MPQISPLKILDEAILPIALVLGTKILSIFVWSLILGISWDFTTKPNTYQLFFFSFQSVENLFVISNISDFLTICVTAGGFSWIIFRTVHFAEENMHPLKKALLFRLNKQSMMFNNHEIFHQAGVWLALSWFVVFLTGNNFLSGFTSSVILSFSVSVAALLTLVLYLNLKRLNR